MKTSVDLLCPVPPAPGAVIQLAHGAGGRWTQTLIESLFIPAFSNRQLDTRHDGAVLDIGDCRVAFTTDTYVVRPLFFPGGNIGTLAVYGTANDLAMCGARPQYISAGFVLEEGLAIDTLRQVVQSMESAALSAGVRLVTGDTKVVERGHGDGVFINTSGLGVVEAPNPIEPSSVQVGDAILVSGDLGRHGMAVMALRENLRFEPDIISDAAPLWPVIKRLLVSGIELHCLRDLTRGGLASALNEIASVRRAGIRILEHTVPVSSPVSAACELLGLDPLYVANEGRFIAFIPANQCEKGLSILRQFPNCLEASCIGAVVADHPGTVIVAAELGGNRVLDMMSGELLPRIC